VSARYDLAEVKDLRVLAAAEHPRSRSGLGGGLIAFDYGPRTIRFCAGVDEAEAKMIVGASPTATPGGGDVSAGARGPGGGWTVQSNTSTRSFCRRGTSRRERLLSKPRSAGEGGRESTG
jgi:hypothetical protein